jgi:hypothetical protein
MVLAILVNMGQLTENIVARSIYWTNLDTTSFTPGGTTPPAIFSTNQASPEGAMNGIKNEVSFISWKRRGNSMLTFHNPSTVQVGTLQLLRRCYIRQEPCMLWPILWLPI